MQLAIPDMTCGGCANAIRRAITNLDPKATLDVEVPAKIATVTSTLTPEQVIKAIEAAGFHPVPRA